jgi:ATPase subunit of ABC transporter with duplicated ATPase domains
MGRNGGGKSSLLRLLWRQMQQAAPDVGLRLHPRLHPGYYDQSLHQLADNATLLEALESFEPAAERRKRALISAGFGWSRHGQKVSTLSGGERSRCCLSGCRWRAIACFCWMSPPTIWIWKAKRRWLPRCASIPAVCCWSVMTVS